MKLFFHEPTLMNWKQECYPIHKIKFIKEVRVFYINIHGKPLGLLEAKNVMEHFWKEWIKEDENTF